VGKEAIFISPLDRNIRLVTYTCGGAGLTSPSLLPLEDSARASHAHVGSATTPAPYVQYFPFKVNPPSFMHLSKATAPRFAAISTGGTPPEESR
jgi:hypothetical protein